MTTLPRISIVTPSFNQAHFIERTILSVLDQCYPDLEYIVIDGGSRDGTIDILKKYEGRLTWISEKDEGQADAINKGMRMAGGEVVAYMNSDDLYEPGTLLRVGRFFAEHPDAHWVTGKCRIIDEHDREVRRLITAYKNFLLRHYSYSLLLVTNPISQPATFWRRSLLDDIGYFNKEEHLVMDYDYWLRSGQRHPLAVLDKYLASFRVHPSSKTSSSFLTTFKRELELAKQHSSSGLLNSLHWMSYALIASAYTVLNAFPRKKK
jgi:glycosyltransferase involved in cell wall biosynthesis